MTGWNDEEHKYQEWLVAVCDEWLDTGNWEVWLQVIGDSPEKFHEHYKAGKTPKKAAKVMMEELDS